MWEAEVRQQALHHPSLLPKPKQSSPDTPMKFRKKNDREIMEGDLTPMIDVTFQLIAFFMLLINFSEVDRAEEIMLPSSILAKPPETRPDYQVILNLNPDGSVVFEGLKVEKIEFLSTILDREVSSAKREGVSADKIAVIIRSHRATPTGLVQELIGKCQSHEMVSFKFRVKERLR